MVNYKHKIDSLSLLIDMQKEIDKTSSIHSYLQLFVNEFSRHINSDITAAILMQQATKNVRKAYVFAEDENVMTSLEREFQSLGALNNSFETEIKHQIKQVLTKLLVRTCELDNFHIVHTTIGKFYELIFVTGTISKDIYIEKESLHLIINQLSHLLQKQLELLHYKNKTEQLIHTIKENEKLSQQALKNFGVSNVCETLAEIIDMPVCLLDSLFYERYASDNFTEHGSFLQSSYMYDVFFVHNELTKKDNVGIFPIKYNRELLGLLLVQIDGKKITEYLQKNINHAVNIIAIEIIKEREIMSAERQLVEEIISEYITNRKTNEFLRKLDTLGVDNQVPCYHISFHNVSKGDMEIVLNVCYLEAQTVTYMPLLTPTGIIFFTKIGRVEVEQYIQHVNELLANQRVYPKFVVGRKVNNILEIDKSYKDSKKMLRHDIFLTKDIVFFDDLKVENLFLLLDQETIADFTENILRHLIRDEERSEMLLETLQTFVDNDKNHKRTCEQLNIHINTLYYRLKLIEKELNVQLNNSEDWLAIHLALKLRFFSE